MNLPATYLAFILLLMSCGHTPLQKTVEFTPLETTLFDELTQNERVIHECLQTKTLNPNDCLKGTEFEKSHREPASTEMILSRYKDFFNDQVKLNRFFKWIKVFRKASADLKRDTGKFVNGKGIGVVGSAYIGLGVEWMAEFDVLNNELGLYCTPGVGVVNDIGASVGVYALQTLSCDSHGDGESISFSVGAGIGSYGSAEIGYGLGIDSKEFLNALKAAKSNKTVNMREVSLELDFLKGQPRAMKELQSSQVILSFGIKALNFLQVGYSDIYSMSSLGKMISQLPTRPQSLGMEFKKSFRSPASQNFFNRYRLPNLRNFLNVLEASLTGCDSIGGTASIGVGMSNMPVALSAFYEKSGLLFQISLKDLKAFSSVTPLTLLNPALIHPNDLRVLGRVSEQVLRIPNTARQKCFTMK